MAKFKFTSYIKALLPFSFDDSIKKRNIPSNYRNLLSVSPKDQNDFGGVVIPRLGANRWRQNNTDLEYLQKLYDCHDLVYSSIDLVSSTFALAKLKVKQYDTKTQKYNYVPNHPLQRLLDNPNSTMNGFDLRQAYIVHRLLFGTMACILLRSDMLVSYNESNKCPECNSNDLNNCIHVLWHFNTGPITQIMPVHLDRLGKRTVKLPNGQEKEYFTYNYNINGKKVETLVHPNNILTDPKYNPGGSFYGTSPTAIVNRWLEVDLGLSKQIGAYLMNNAIPSMILNIKPPKISDGIARIEDPSTLLEKMKEKWMKDFSMNNNRDSDYNESSQKLKAPAFVYGDLELLKIQDGIKDIVQKPLFFEIQSRIASVYKVPRTYFEFGLAHGVDSEKENKNFFNYAIAPELVSFKGKIERYILPSYNDPTLEVEWDLSSMGIADFLEDKREAKILKKWEDGLLTRDHARELLGYNPTNDEFGNDYYRLDVLGTNTNGERLNQPNQPGQDNILKPNPQSTNDAGGNLNE